MKRREWFMAMVSILAFTLPLQIKLQGTQGKPMSTQEVTMKTEAPRPIFLADYKPPAYLIKDVRLCFELANEKTVVTAEMSVQQNPSSQEKAAPLILNGSDLKLISIKIDGRVLDGSEYVADENTLTIKQTPKSFILEVVNEIHPEKNLSLDGLYKSGSIFCTQNEPEGFRKITYFLDRSDVMAKYTTKIIADQKLYPILLSNGNEIGRGTLKDGKHWVEWEDPFAKPSYLFALVAGDLGCTSDTFTTMSGRTIDLKIYCDKGNEPKCRHAMQSLIKAMRWDEKVYGLEYDLDTFMIVAVDAFNMGAMENKGLNIFNTSCVLADEASATDENYARIETVIAHEYFHNWTGNRVTCRDWFQLTLKEGLTVFRDQEFSADMHSRPLQRIENVLSLRANQFPEDAGPSAHPIKPKSYLQINNFYTPTVYNKGAEVVRMIETLLGHDTFRKGIAKYFELYDGQAVTTDDFVHAMELVSGKDLTQFKRWYTQAGTPTIHVGGAYEPVTKKYTLTIKQSCPPSADHSEKEPFHFPLALGLLDREGRDLPLKIDGKVLLRPIIEITQAEESFVFEEIPMQPVLSINRHFSAPIEVKINYSLADYQLLMAHDSDPFNRWEAGQKLATTLMLNMARNLSEGRDFVLDPGFIQAFGAILDDPSLDNALKARALVLPSEDALSQFMEPVDIDGIHLVREYTRHVLAETYKDKFQEIYQTLHTAEPYHFDATAVGKRSLKNGALSYLSLLENRDDINRAFAQFTSAQNMTDQFAALTALSNISCPEREQALSAFYTQWKKDTLVMNKWLAVQALSKLDGTFESVNRLLKDPVYDPCIPNLVRALILTFAQNNIHFHRNDGVGYAFMADRLLETDRYNPQLAAGLARTFRKYNKLDHLRKAAMKLQLQRILAQEGLSTNVYEIISQLLAWEAHRAKKEDK